MKKLILRMKMLRAFVGLVKDPRQTERIFDMADAGRAQSLDRVEATLRPLLERDDFKSLYSVKYNPAIPDAAELKHLPEGSFGRAFADFLHEHGFTADSFPKISTDSPVEYFITRMRRTHDFWHVLTGYDTSIADELALQGFTLAQVGSPLSVLILAGGLLHLAIFKPLEVTKTFDLIVQGYQRGQRSRKLVGVRLEDQWERSLQDMRAELSIA